MKITPKQRELLSLIRDGAGIRQFSSPGCEHLPSQCYLLRKDDHRDLDGRTVRSLDQRGLIKYDGDGTYIISDLGKAAVRKTR